MNGTRLTRCACMLLAVALMGGCANLQPPAPEAVSVHVLAARPPLPPPAQRREIAIEVAAPRAWPGFDTADIVYVRGPYELERFALNRWVDTPAHMLAPLVVRALEDTGSFRAVVQPPGAAPADFRLDTEIVRVVQDFRTRPSRTEIAVRAQITDLGTRRVIATRVFEDSEAAPSENAAGGVAAANAALTRMLGEIARFCVAETSRP